MKLLLTSAGITNELLADALEQLVGKSRQETKIGVVSTAANQEPGNKDWFIAQFTNLQQYGFAWIDMVDPSADGTPWQERLKDVHAVFISGGNTFHLLNQTRKTGFDSWLKENLESKVYVGMSAGTIMASPTIEVATIEPADRNYVGLEDVTGLGLVDFEIEPHCDGERFSVIEQYAKENHRRVYALDDQSAIKVDGDTVEVISEGKWKLFEA